MKVKIETEYRSEYDDFMVTITDESGMLCRCEIGSSIEEAERKAMSRFRDCLYCRSTREEEIDI